MMENSKESTSLFEGLILKPEQDFHFGAKAKSYPSQSLEPTLKLEADSTDWQINNDYFGENYTPFEDAILPDEFNLLDPDKLFDPNQLGDIFTEELLPPSSELLPSPLLPPVQAPEVKHVEQNSWEGKSDACQELLTTFNNKPFRINLKTVRLPKSKNVQQNTHFEPPVEKKEKMTLKDAINLGCADNVLEQLMEVVHSADNNSSTIDQLYSFIDSDSDSSMNIDSPTYSSDFSSSSPIYGDSVTFDLSDQDYSINSPSSESSFPSTSGISASKSKSKSVKRLPKRQKLTVEEKKLKKMEQNKRAATRYRQKKKQEENFFLDKLKAEEARKDALTMKYKNLKHEIRVMKKVIRELFIAKGMISAEAFEK